MPDRVQVFPKSQAKRSADVRFRPIADICPGCEAAEMRELNGSIRSRVIGACLFLAGVATAWADWQWALGPRVEGFSIISSIVGILVLLNVLPPRSAGEASVRSNDPHSK